MSSATPTNTPIVAGPGAGEAFWFFGTLVLVKAAGEGTEGAMMVTENLAPRGAGSPLHVHSREDEWFYVIEGELTLWVGGEVLVAPAGSFVLGPKGIPHTFLVSSEQARFLLGTAPAGFEEFIRAVGEPAPRLEIPPPAEEAPDAAALAKLAATFGIEILGPPGIPD